MSLDKFARITSRGETKARTLSGRQFGGKVARLLDGAHEDVGMLIQVV